ncbi:sensor histidine kinase [Chitinophaga niabensis]|uniref:GHKL domain-containing protein n=1 Tax=Chitinophaga niabensis TaxID=536979 RepID=A0A1N6EE09_9BACT|nr:histidine kinase [Chitinophaga niabensis]SIN81263.1 GHKL domain-containing protein [Chitinophaga niabensis]
MKVFSRIIKWRLHHVFFWLAFFVVWITLRIDDYPDLLPTILAGLLKVLSLAGAVYFTNYVLIPRQLYTKQYLAFFLSFTALVLVTGFLVIKILNLILTPYASSITHWPNATFNSQVYDVYIPLFFMVGAAAGIKFYIDQLRTLHRLQGALRAGAEQELQYLRAQINPHSLFNSLNTIYFLINKENKEARETLMKFSDLLRYQLYDCNTDRIDIEKEIQYLKNFVSIQQLRHDEKYRISFHADENVRDFSIAPLLLITFVENAFKHVSAHEQNEINITLKKEQGKLQLIVHNTKEHSTRKEEAGGIGLANVKRRLELLYPDKYTLDISDNSTTFTVTLILDIS